MSTATATPEGSATRARWTELPQRDGLGQQVADMFSPPSAMSAAAGGTAPKVEAAPAAAAPTMPYRVAGRVRLEDKQHIVLAKETDVVIAREGDRLDQGYRVESIRPDYVTLLFSPLRARHKLPVVLDSIIQQQRAYGVQQGAPQAMPSQPPSLQPASLPSVQLRWEGPPQVKVGTPFTVTVKGSASDAMSAVPLQLSYDPAVLQLSSVKAGGFFADGNFTSRTDKPGSVFVVTSGKAKQPVDAELVIATFRPLRSGVVAELGVAPGWQQAGAANAPAPEAPLPFRTAIGN